MWRGWGRPQGAPKSPLAVAAPRLAPIAIPSAARAAGTPPPPRSPGVTAAPRPEVTVPRGLPRAPQRSPNLWGAPEPSQPPSSAQHGTGCSQSSCQPAMTLNQGTVWQSVPCPSVPLVAQPPPRQEWGPPIGTPQCRALPEPQLPCREERSSRSQELRGC